ncbi:MAG: hypothetical protein IPH40_03495 [Polaromonas sp.]|nr:hypothetical protein [Polaromonas sp.]
MPALFWSSSQYPFAWAWLLPTDMRDFSQSLVAVATFSIQYFILAESGYFEEAAELSPLLHTWSLSARRAVLCLVPLILIAVLRRFGKRLLLVLVGLTFIASLTLAQWGVQNYPSLHFYYLPVDGAIDRLIHSLYLLSAKRQNFDRIVCEIGGWLGIAFILFALFTFNQKMPFPRSLCIVANFGCGVIHRLC